MKLNVNLPSIETIVLDVESTDTIMDVKVRILESTGLQPDKHWLVNDDVKLTDTWPLSAYNFPDNFTVQLQNIQETRAARKAARKAAKGSAGSSPASSSEDEVAPPPPLPSISIADRRKPLSSWRDYGAEQEAKESAQEKSRSLVASKMVGEYDDDVSTLMGMGMSEATAEMLALEMTCAMAGVCDWCGRKGGCSC